MENNKTGKYLKYAIGEIALVVIGILIALQINNLNEKKNTEIKTQEYYSQLLEDLKSDQVFAAQTNEANSEQLTAYENYTNLYYSDEVLTPNQVYDQISKLPLIINPLTFNSSTIEALQNSGDIRLIPSNIRNRLIDLKRLQSLTITRQEQIGVGTNSLVQKLSTLLGATTLPERLENQPKLNDFLNIEANLKKLILEYEGIHRWREVSLNETIGRLEQMSKDIDAVVELINAELEN